MVPRAPRRLLETPQRCLTSTSVPDRTASIDLTDLDRFAHGFPHDDFAHLRREHPLWWHPPTAATPDGEGFWVVSRHADCRDMAGDPATFSSEGGPGRAGGGTLIEDLPAGFAAGVLVNMMDDPRHHRIRQLLTPSVSPRRLRAMEDDLRARTAAILDSIAEGGRCDFLRDVAAELPLQAIAWLLGVPQSDRHLLLEWADATLDYDDRDLGEQSAAAEQASAEMFEYGARLLAEKAACPADDLLSVVATAEIDDEERGRGPLTDLEQQMFFNLLIAAGSETTRNTIAAGLLALIEHPDQWTRLRADPGLMPTAVEEMLRYASSTTYNRRTATVAVERHGQRIEPGDKVTLWWGSANHDEAAFEDPARFDVGRDPNPHLAFGHGAHFCLGAALARVEIRLIFEAILARFDQAELDGPVEWVRSNKHTGMRHLPVRFDRVRMRPGPDR
jgi:cytochrome P450